MHQITWVHPRWGWATCNWYNSFIDSHSSSISNTDEENHERKCEEDVWILSQLNCQLRSTFTFEFRTRKSSPNSYSMLQSYSKSDINLTQFHNWFHITSWIASHEKVKEGKIEVAYTSGRLWTMPHKCCHPSSSPAPASTHLCHGSLHDTVMDKTIARQMYQVS